MDFFCLYVLHSNFRPRDVLVGIFLLFFHKLRLHLHVHKTTLERNYSVREASRGLKWKTKRQAKKVYYINWSTLYGFPPLKQKKNYLDTYYDNFYVFEIADQMLT